MAILLKEHFLHMAQVCTLMPLIQVFKAFVRLNAAEAAIAIPGKSYEKELINFIQNGEEGDSVDVTLGKALKIEEGNDTLFEHLLKVEVLEL